MSLIKEPGSANEWSAINRAFSKQAVHFDENDSANPILQAWRSKIYKHIEGFLKPGDRLLELNAGTGIDAFYFAEKGYAVHATDLSTGMVRQMEKKLVENPMPRFTYQQISVEHLDRLEQDRFEYVFSNFGGLNCVRDLSVVTQHLSDKLIPGAYLTWVVMPPVCPWEWLWILKGEWRDAFRRFQSDGAPARLEGELLQTYYHSHSDIRKALGSSFVAVKSEGLGVFSAPPSAMNFYKKYPGLYRQMNHADGILSRYFPFNHWGDHIIATFQKVK